jgi:oligosaccharyltransferase complex subunit gamma
VSTLLALALDTRLAARAGGLFNIIRGVPLITPGPRGTVLWYTPPNAQGQLGAEGFFVGSLYIVFALACTAIILLPKWLGSTKRCRVLSYAALLTALFACLKVIEFYTYKTGYRFRVYVLESMSLRRSAA